MSINNLTPVVISSSPKFSSQGNNIALSGNNFIPINNTNNQISIDIVYLVLQNNPLDEIEMYAFPRENNNLEFGFNDRPGGLYSIRTQTNFFINNIKEGSKYNIIVKSIILYIPPENIEKVSQNFLQNIKFFIEKYTTPFQKVLEVKLILMLRIHLIKFTLIQL